MHTQENKGLTTAEAQRRLAEYGPNALPTRRSAPLWLVFLRQFKNAFIYVLLVAAIVSFGLDHTVNALFIMAVLLLNATIGTVQEYSAEQSAAALKKMVPSFAMVYRDGRPTRINTTDVVPGDWIQLVSGDKVPADLHLDFSHDLQIDESMLTGESIPADKLASQRTVTDIDAPNHSDCCFAGTVVMHGRGEGEVLATGDQTEIGKIAADVKVDEVKPPLLLRIERFTLFITYTILGLISAIFLATLIQGGDLTAMFLFGVAMAVSAIPEGLPAAITIALAIGMRRMAKVNVIIRKLLAVEALGSCTYIASDKTGTLTVNEMTIRRIELPDGTTFDVSGEGLDLHGEVTALNNQDDLSRLKLLATASLLANEATMELMDTIESRENPEVTGEQIRWHGDHVDIAFLIMAEKYGIEHEEARGLHTELGRIPYESENAYSASLNRYNDKPYLFVKGSVERLLNMAHAAEGVESYDRAAITQQTVAMAAQGYRVLGLAYAELDEIPVDLESSIKELTFLGMVGMIDPLRPEVIDAVEHCHTASIRVAMVTGDHPQTAIALAREAGLADENTQPVSGHDLARAEEEAGGTTGVFREMVLSTTVFARIAPHQKKQIVEVLIDSGEFVAVTGDGVNDAPALSNAHVGVAMGERGTDVARESSDLILTDDNFASIVDGVKQGRVVYNNIRKVIFLLISTGMAEIVLVLLSLFFGTPLPLFPVQLLWLNLVTNGIQDIALAFEPAEGDELSRPPRAPKEPIFNRLMLERVIINALVMGVVAFTIFKWQLEQGVGEFEARNITLLLMVLFENVHVLNSRSETRSIFHHYLFGNNLLLFGMLTAQMVHIAALYTPGLRDILEVQPVSFEQWLTLLGIALILVAVNEFYKLYYGATARS